MTRLAEGQLTDRADIMAAMGELKLYAMRAAYDELMAVAVRRQHEPRQIVGDLLDLHRFCSGEMLMLGGPLFEGHG